MNLLYITFGTQIETHYQANFSILSFLREKLDLSITVITDHADFYNHIKDQVHVWEIDAQTLQAWRGKHDYIYRTKIKALEKMEEQYPGQPLMYLDADTFLYTKLSDFSQQLSAEKAFMHEREGELSTLNTKTEKTMWRQLQGRVFGGIKIQPQHVMWNAGVVLLPGKKNKEAIALALKICDDMCDAHVLQRLIEQFSFSVALDHIYGLHPASRWICHYWGNKGEWGAQISSFFLSSRLKQQTLMDEIKYLQQFDFTVIPFS